jgi:hypothetical protein
MPAQLGKLMFDAFGCVPQALTHKIALGHYSVMFPDHGITFDVKPPMILVLCWLDQKEFPLDEDWRFKTGAIVALGYALAHFDDLTADKKLWLHDRFRLHLGEARLAGIEFWRTQKKLARMLEEEYGKRRTEHD